MTYHKKGRKPSPVAFFIGFQREKSKKKKLGWGGMGNRVGESPICLLSCGLDRGNKGFGVDPK